MSSSCSDPVLRAQELIASGPRSPQPGAPYTYVTTKTFLSQFGLDTLRQLPDFEALEDAGLLSKEKFLAGDIPTGLASAEGDDEQEIALLSSRTNCLEPVG